jgi:HEAT repeat protein
MTLPVLDELAADLRRLLAAGAGAAAGDGGLRRRAIALRQHAASVPALAALADALRRATEAAEPAVALLELLVRLRQARSALASSGVAGEFHPLPPSGPWRTPAAAAPLWGVVEGLEHSGQRGYAALTAQSEVGGVGDLRLLRPLLGVLHNPYSALADFIAVRVLPAFGRAVVAELRSECDLRGKAVDGRRLMALAHCDRRAGRALCQEALRRGSPAVRAAALHGLSLSEPEEADREAVMALAGTAPKSLKRAALDLLSQRTVRTEGAAPALLRALFHGSHDLNWRAARALARQGKRAVPALAEALRDPDPERRRQAIWVLRDIGPEARPATPALVAALADAGEVYGVSIPDCARAALGQIGPAARSAVPALTRNLRAPDAHTRFMAADALVRITGRTRRYLPFILDLLADQDWEVRREAFLSLERTGPAAEAAVPRLIEILKDPEDELQHFAASALAHIGRSAGEVVPLLIAMVGEGAWHLRLTAIYALGLFGRKARAALPVLHEAAKECSRPVQEAVRRAVVAIQGPPEEAAGAP